ncbi:MAG: helix-turn-helix transcriptional regulator [Proteobacteria bacterium]|nr:helix-turn-helix transcriptional regulator [Pseudomonadota bacterium]
MSQEEAAIASDLSAQTIQRIEAGNPASLESTKALLTTFGAEILCDPAVQEVPIELPTLRSFGLRLVRRARLAAGWSFDAVRLVFVAAFIAAGLGKLFLPASTGLFTGDGAFALGIFASPPAAANELLGYWIIPLMLSCAAALLLTIGRARRMALNRP